MNLTREQITAFIEKSIGFVERMGLKALEIEPGRVKLTAPLSGNVNHIGSIYAGALFTLAEMPGGALFLTSFDPTRYYPIIKEMTIRFLKPVRTDVTVELTMDEAEVRRIAGEADEKGKADYVLEGEIKDAAGEVVAVSRGLYQVRARSG
jgi:thioesterase domain-containing protein